MLPVWEENNRNELAAGREKKPVIKPVLIDREIPVLQKELDEIERSRIQVGGKPVGALPNEPVDSSGLTAEKKKEFIEVTGRLKLLTDRRAQILARVGDDYVTAPPKLPAKP